MVKATASEWNDVIDGDILGRLAVEARLLG